MFTKLHKNFNNLVRHKTTIKDLYMEKFDPTIQKHVKMLLDIWKTLKGNEAIELKDKKWRIYSI